MNKYVLYFFLFLPSLLFSRELAPWFGRSLEIELRSTLLLQDYQFIATPIRPNKYSSFDQFYSVSASSAFDFVAAETEFVFSNTSAHSFSLDSFWLTARLRLSDDIVGDPLSVTTGFSFIAAERNAVKDLSSFHHGTLGGEIHLAFGKEMSVMSFWTYRFWGLFAFGLANQGSPWIRGNLTWEKNLFDVHQFQVFVHSLWGLGDRNIDLLEPFEGYGLIKHRSVDLGLRYSYLIQCWGAKVEAEYIRRLYAQNFPDNANLIVLRLLYPFGL